MSKKGALPTWKLYAAFIIAGLMALAYAIATYYLPTR